MAERGTATESGRAFALRVAILALPMLLLLPFLNKAYHIDDILFLWVTEQIQRAPLDFYGFTVNYGRAAPHIYEIFHNPPVVSYYLALFGAVFGGNEAVYHIAMLLPTALTLFGMYLFVRELAPAPVLVTAFAALTPAFMVSASTLMADVPLVGFYVWAVYAWRRGMIARDLRWLAIAGILAGFAVLTKYFGLTLIPLFLLDGFVRRRKPGIWLATILIPVAMTAMFELWTYWQYGVVTLFDASGVALAGRWRAEEIATTRWVLTLVFLGGCFAPMIFLLRVKEAWRRLAITAGIVALLCAPAFDGYSVAQLMIGSSEPYGWSRLVTFGAMLWLGAALLVETGLALWRRRDADAVLLAAWIGGTFVFCAAVNHYVNARTLLPMLPALAVAVGHRAVVARGAAWRVGVAAALALWLLAADYDVAEHNRRAAAAAVELAQENNAPLYHIAFWGFEYYMLRAGSTPLAFENTGALDAEPRPNMPPGALLAVHAVAAPVWEHPPPGFRIERELDLPYRWYATTFDERAGAGFYWHHIGSLPFAFGRIPPERFLILRYTGPDTNAPDA